MLNFRDKAYIHSQIIRDEFKKKCPDKIKNGLYDPLDLVAFTLLMAKTNDSIQRLKEDDILKK